MPALMVEVPRNMPAIDPLATRVAARHRAGVVGDVSKQGARVENMKDGKITAAELTRMLEPIVGSLARMLFHRPSASAREVGWAAVTPDGGVVSGMLVLHTTVTDDEVRSWAELTIDPPGTSVVVGPEDVALINPATSTLAASRAGIEYQRRTHGLERVEHQDDDLCVGGEPDEDDDPSLT
jgi:hypothetical protein